jgi:hypothetical protein
MMALSENHHRVMSSIAQVAESKLLEMEILFEKLKTGQNISLQWNNDLTEEQKEKIRSSIRRAYEVLREFQGDFNLSVHEKSLRKTISTQAYFLWEELAGSTAKRLRGYGETEDDMLKEFERYIKQLTDVVNQIIKDCE